MDSVGTRHDAPHARANPFFENAIIGWAAERTVPCLLRHTFETMLDVASTLTGAFRHTCSQAAGFPRKSGATPLSPLTFQEVE
jgi:hypothetical protein